MKKTHENTGSQAMWRRALALLVALSLVLIPVKFPGAAKAVGQTVTETAPGSYFSDDFSDDSLLQGVTYKWNYAGMGNHSIAGGKLQLGVSGDTLCGCGGWSCPEFFEAFEAAL